MAAPSAATSNNRRSRKRRRRQRSYSAGSTSDSSSDNEDVKPKTSTSMDVDESSAASSSSSSSDSSSSSSSSSSSDSDNDSNDASGSDSDDDNNTNKTTLKLPITTTKTVKAKPSRATVRYPTLSPSPPARELPSFLGAAAKGKGKASSSTESAEKVDQERREKFRNVYMSKLVEAFGGDLEKMRESDSTLGPDRLQRLIESLQSGTEVYSDPRQPRPGQNGEIVDEVGLLIGQS